jgi:hypothetical protein
VPTLAMVRSPSSSSSSQHTVTPAFSREPTLTPAAPPPPPPPQAVESSPPFGVPPSADEVIDEFCSSLGNCRCRACRADRAEAAEVARRKSERNQQQAKIAKAEVAPAARATPVPARVAPPPPVRLDVSSASASGADSASSRPTGHRAAPPPPPPPSSLVSEPAGTAAIEAIYVSSSSGAASATTPALSPAAPAAGPHRSAPPPPPPTVVMHAASPTLTVISVERPTGENAAAASARAGPPKKKIFQLDFGGPAADLTSGPRIARTPAASSTPPASRASAAGGYSVVQPAGATPESSPYVSVSGAPQDTRYVAVRDIQPAAAADTLAPSPGPDDTYLQTSASRAQTPGYLHLQSLHSNPYERIGEQAGPAASVPAPQAPLVVVRPSNAYAEVLDTDRPSVAQPPPVPAPRSQPASVYFETKQGGGRDADYMPVGGAATGEYMDAQGRQEGNYLAAGPSTDGTYLATAGLAGSKGDASGDYMETTGHAAAAAKAAKRGPEDAYVDPRDETDASPYIDAEQVRQAQREQHVAEPSPSHHGADGQKKMRRTEDGEYVEAGPVEGVYFEHSAAGARDGGYEGIRAGGEGEYMETQKKAGEGAYVDAASVREAMAKLPAASGANTDSSRNGDYDDVDGHGAARDAYTTLRADEEGAYVSADARAAYIDAAAARAARQDKQESSRGDEGEYVDAEGVRRVRDGDYMLHSSIDDGDRKEPEYVEASGSGGSRRGGHAHAAQKARGPLMEDTYDNVAQEQVAEYEEAALGTDAEDEYLATDGANADSRPSRNRRAKGSKDSYATLGGADTEYVLSVASDAEGEDSASDDGQLRMGRGGSSRDSNSNANSEYLSTDGNAHRTMLSLDDLPEVGADDVHMALMGSQTLPKASDGYLTVNDSDAQQSVGVFSAPLELEDLMEEETFPMAEAEQRLDAVAADGEGLVDRDGEGGWPSDGLGMIYEQDEDAMGLMRYHRPESGFVSDVCVCVCVCVCCLTW